MKQEFRIDLKTIWDSSTEDDNKKYKACIHSGNAGDIIYSLPIVKSLGAEHFIINLCTDPCFGGRSINLDIAHSLSPLLLKQSYIKRVSIVNSNIPLEYIETKIVGVDFVLDKFRLQDFTKHHLAICHALAFQQRVDLNNAWLSVDANDKLEDYAVVAFTPRYRSFVSEYWLKALSGLHNIKVLGLPEEFYLSAGMHAEFITCNDFLKMAKIIYNAKIFIGNPSMAYAIAEGLKVPRIIEVPESPRNAYPIGKNGYIASDSIDETRKLIEKVIGSNYSETSRFNNKNIMLVENVQNLDVQLNIVLAELNEILSQLNLILGSSVWKYARDLDKIKNLIFPENSYRKKMFRHLYKFLKQIFKKIF